MSWSGVVGQNFRSWITIDDGKGVPKAGLVAGNFTTTVVALDDSASTVVTVTESSQVNGLYYFDVPGSFLTTHGAGEYGVHIVVVDTGPKFNAISGKLLMVTQIDIDSLTSSVYNDGTHIAITFNANKPNTNTEFGVDGTPGNPVSTEAALLTLLTTLGVNAVSVQDGTLTLTQAFEDFVFYSCNQFNTGEVAFNGQDVQGSCFKDILISGTVDAGATFILATDCDISSVSNFPGLAKRCRLGGTISTAGSSQFTQCDALGGGGGVTLSAASGATTQIEVTGWLGGDLSIASVTGATVVQLDLLAGNLDLLASNTNGVFTVRGRAGLTNSVTGAATVDTTDLVQPKDIDQINKTTSAILGNVV